MILVIIQIFLIACKCLQEYKVNLDKKLTF